MKNKLIIIIIMVTSKLVYAGLCSNPKYKICGEASANTGGGNSVALKCQQNQCQSNTTNALATIASQGHTLATELFGAEGLLSFAQRNINSLHNVIASNLLHTVPFDEKDASISIISENTPTYASFSPDNLNTDAYKNNSISTSNIMYVLGQAAYANFYNPNIQNTQTTTPGYDALAGYKVKPSAQYQPAALECLSKAENTWTNGTCLSPYKKECLKYHNYWINGDCVSSLKDRCSGTNKTYTAETETAGSSCSCNDNAIFNYNSAKGECVSCGNKVKVLNSITDLYECQTPLQVACDKLTNAKYDKVSDKCICTNKDYVYTSGDCNPKPKPVKAAPVKAAPVKAAPVKAAPVKAAPVKAAPVKAAPVKAAPVKAAVTGLQKACINTKVDKVAAKWKNGKCECPDADYLYLPPTDESGKIPGECFKI